MKFFWNKAKEKAKGEETIETSFLVPLRENPNPEYGGNGGKHSAELFALLILFLEKLFGGQTKPRTIYDGSWVNPATGETIPDESIRVYVAIKRKELPRLKQFIKLVVIMFKQECIYFVSEGGKVDYIDRKVESVTK